MNRADLREANKSGVPIERSKNGEENAPNSDEIRGTYLAERTVYTEGFDRPYISGETQILADLSGAQKCSMLFPVFLEIFLMALLLAASATGRSYLNGGYFLCSLTLIFLISLGYYKGRPVSLAKDRRRLR